MIKSIEDARKRRTFTGIFLISNAYIFVKVTPKLSNNPEMRKKGKKSRPSFNHGVAWTLIALQKTIKIPHIISVGKVSNRRFQEIDWTIARVNAFSSSINFQNNRLLLLKPLQFPLHLQNGPHLE